MATPNPVAGMFAQAPQASKKTFFIAGIHVDVFGLDELPADSNDVACLWLLHPRLSKKAQMEPVAHAAIAAWNDKLRSGVSPANKQRGVIAVSFDQRNHGTRLIDKLSNEAWGRGNPTHAQDMFTIFQGTAIDTSQLIDYLPAYAFPRSQRTISRHMVLGVSLGAHAAWHCLLRDSRITGAVIIVGCADYTRLMRLRAEQSKLESWTASSPSGIDFLGSPDFPPALIAAVREWDPTGLLCASQGLSELQEPSPQQLETLLPLARARLAGKRILNLAGGDDKLVPHSCSVPFLTWLSNAISPMGWLRGQGISLIDKVYPGIGHQFSSDMQSDALAWLLEEAARPSSRSSANL